ncbi:MAG: DeoR/GlpR family DNA-binding transcription regulator, partial [Microcoleaceae cyanobacterium]
YLHGGSGVKREERQQAIMDVLVLEGEASLDELSVHFEVSKMTVHRDLDDLESAGLLRKVRGGATIQSGTQFESDYRLRARQGAVSKNAMAEAALSLIEPGMTVMINDGSMAAVLAQKCSARRPLTIITNNAAVIDAQRNEPGITLITLGGVYSSKYNAYLGKVTEDTLAGLRADIAFISSPAVSGVEVFHMDDSVVRAKRAMMEQAAKCCLLVNHTRFGHAALHRLAKLDEFANIITDQTPDADAIAEFQRAGLNLTIAAREEGTP